MLKAEANAIREVLAENYRYFSASNEVLNIGSQTSEFREITQPFIGELFSWVESKFLLRAVHCDLFDGDGVDLVFDITSPDLGDHLRGHEANLVFLSNLLEHVSEPIAVITALSDWMSPGQVALITGPSRFPYHPDPIDNMFRVAASELSDLISEDFEILAQRDVKEFHFWQYFNKTGSRLDGIKHLIGAIFRWMLSGEADWLYGWVRPSEAFIVLARRRS